MIQISHRALSVLAAALVLFGGAVSCKPTPEKVCDHEVEVSPAIAARDCTERVTDLQKRSPALFDSYAACSKDAKNMASLATCVSDVDRQLAAQVSVALTGSSVSVNGTAISASPTVADFERVLGKGYSKVEGDETHNTRYHWEAYGLQVSTPMGKDSASSLQVWFQPPQGTAFSGKLTVEGKPVEKSATATTLKAIPGVKDAAIAGASAFDVRGISTYFLPGKGDGFSFVDVRFVK